MLPYASAKGERTQADHIIPLRDAIGSHTFYVSKMIDKKAFKKTFGAPFKEAGYFKRGQSWYLNGEDTIIVVNLQKSDWGDLYYINIGIWLKKLGEPIYPIGL